VHRWVDSIGLELVSYGGKPCSLPGFSHDGLSKAHAGATAVLVDEFHADGF
jgi:hypothetical protein